MGCCGSKDKVESVPQHEKPMVNWGGNLKRHTYTDIGCLIIFIVFLVVWAVIGVVSILQGDITKVHEAYKNFETTFFELIQGISEDIFDNFIFS